MTTRVRVVLVEDHDLVREMLEHHVNSEPGFEVVATAADADAGLEAVMRNQPDVVVMDIDMPGRDTFDVAEIMRQACPNTRILFLSGLVREKYLELVLGLGAAGYLVKSEPLHLLIDAIRTAASGGVYYSEEVRQRIAAFPVRSGAGTTPQRRTRLATLTPRELEVLRYIARGHSRKEIAQHMHISIKTVERHSDSIMTKLDIHDRVGLARLAIREGLVEP